MSNKRKITGVYINVKPVAHCPSGGWCQTINGNRLGTCRKCGEMPLLHMFNGARENFQADEGWLQ